MTKKFDFSGYATKNNIKCSDGRTILKDAFKHHDGQVVPLVWQHMHNDPSNYLGHALLENREDGVYAYGVFNDTPSGENAKRLVMHKDITALSIYANQLEEQGKIVKHGQIREVSLVLAGANPGAMIDNLAFSHSDGKIDLDETEAVIYTGLEIELEKQEVTHSEPETTDVEHAESEEDNRTVEEILKTFTPEQMNVVYALIADVAGKAEDESAVEHSNEGGTKMKRNAFDNTDIGAEQAQGKVLSHKDVENIFKSAEKVGSLKEAYLAHITATYGIDAIDILFPEAQTLNNTPQFIKRDMAWVDAFMKDVRHTPFSKIKTVFADITPDEARAKGYVKGNLKVEEVFGLLQRETGPQTIYKKQKLDRDDIVDITSFDVVSYIKGEMRMMLMEEIARAALVSDGRVVGTPDKIKEDKIRPILKDDDFYAHHVELANDIATKDLIDKFVEAREVYEGTGNPNLYTTTAILTSMLLLKDTLGRRLYSTKAELASALLVNDIIEVPVMKNVTRVRASDSKEMSLVGIVVNLADYAIGADKGGEVNLFDDFDIDYNQYKYLMETRISGALTLPKSALVFEKLPVAG